MICSAVPLEHVGNEGPCDEERCKVGRLPFMLAVPPLRSMSVLNKGRHCFPTPFGPDSHVRRPRRSPHGSRSVGSKPDNPRRTPGFRQPTRPPESRPLRHKHRKRSWHRPRARRRFLCFHVREFTDLLPSFTFSLIFKVELMQEAMPVAEPSE